jgi:hypothetical protein
MGGGSSDEETFLSGQPMGMRSQTVPPCTSPYVERALYSLMHPMRSVFALREVCQRVACTAAAGQEQQQGALARVRTTTLWR